MSPVPKLPLISIVSVCFRNPAELLATIKSCEGLDRTTFEHIIVDGSPDDSCIEAVRIAGIPVDPYIHEPDRGIFDAMRKGASRARGFATLMLNSGDVLHNSVEFDKFVRENAGILDSHIIYGDSFFKFGHALVRQYEPAEIGAEAIRKGILPCHQSTLVPTSYCKKNEFDEKLPLSADTLFLRNAYKDLPQYRTESAISVFSYGGESNTARSFRRTWQSYKGVVGARELYSTEKVGKLLQLYLRLVSTIVLGAENHRKVQKWKAGRRLLRNSR